MTDPVHWNSFRDRFHADELVRSDALRGEVEQVLREHSGLSDAQIRTRMRDFDRLFGSDGRIYDGQRRGQAELRALWNWIDRFDRSGSYETMSVPTEQALGHACATPSDDTPIAARLLRTIRPNLGNDVSLTDTDFRSYFANGELHLNRLSAPQREALERVGLMTYFERHNDNGVVRLSPAQARMLFSTTEFRPDKDDSGNSAVLAFRPHDDACGVDENPARLTDLGRAFLAMDAAFLPADGVARPGTLEAAGFVAERVDPDFAPGDIVEQANAERAPPHPEPVEDAVRTDEEAAVRTDEEAAVRTDEEAAVRTDEEAAVRTDEEAAVRTDEEAAVRTDEEAAVRTDEEAAVRTDEEAAVLADGEEAMAGGPVETAAIEMPPELSTALGDRTDIGESEFLELFRGRVFDPRSSEEIGSVGMDPNDRERIEAIEGFEGRRLSMETIENLTGSDNVLNGDSDWRALYRELEKIDENGSGGTIRLRNEEGELTPVGQVVSVIGHYNGELIGQAQHLSSHQFDGFNFDALDQPWSDDLDQSARERLRELAQRAPVSEEAVAEYLTRVENLSGQHTGTAPAALIYRIADLLDNSGSGENIVRWTEGNGTQRRTTVAGQAYEILSSLGSPNETFPRLDIDESFLDRNGEILPVNVPTWDEVPAAWQAFVGLRVGQGPSERGEQVQRILSEVLHYDLSMVGGVDRAYGAGSHAATRDAILLWNYYTGQSVRAEDTFDQEMVTALFGMASSRVIDRLPTRMRQGLVRTDVWLGGNQRTEVLRSIDGVVRSGTDTEISGALAQTRAALSFTAFMHFLRGRGEHTGVPVGPNGPNAFRTWEHQERLYRNPAYAAYPPGHRRANHQGALALDVHLHDQDEWDRWGEVYGVSRPYKTNSREQHHWEYTSDRFPDEARRFFGMPVRDDRPVEEARRSLLQQVFGMR